MNNREFVTSLRTRMYMQFSRYRPNVTCICGRRCPKKITSHADHVAMGCGFGGTRHRIHDDVKHQTKALARWVGHEVRVEEYNVFAALVNENKRNERPDLSINNYGPNGEKLLMDICIPSTMRFNEEGTPYTNNPVGYAANSAYARKINDYGESCRELNYLFEPIVIESCGYVHPKSEAAIRKLVKAHEGDLDCKKNQVFAYTMKVISVALQRSIANCMHKKYDIILRKTYNGEADRVHDQAINQEQERIF